MMSHAGRTLQFWSENSMTPIIALKVDDEDGDIEVTFDDNSTISYEAYQGHVCLVARDANKLYEADW